jgi:predicted dienelactone hydrolase
MGTGRLLAIAVIAAVTVSAAGYAVAARSAISSDRNPAPTRAFSVGHRILPLARGHDRPLPTDVWFPTVGQAVAPGRFPVVLFSHGLRGLPEHFVGLASRWASAGMVVVAPSYPHTNARTRTFERADMRNQPADAEYVLRRLRRLGAGDPLARHLDTRDVAAVGFSAGAFTTTALLTSGQDNGIRAAVIIAGWAAPSAFTGSPVPLLFVHGDADPIVPFESGRAAFERTDWPKSFVTVHGGRHGEFLRPANRNFARVADRLTAFLRANLFATPTRGPKPPSDPVPSTPEPPDRPDHSDEDRAQLVTNDSRTGAPAAPPAAAQADPPAAAQADPPAAAQAPAVPACAADRRAGAAAGS